MNLKIINTICSYDFENNPGAVTQIISRISEDILAFQATKVTRCTGRRAGDVSCRSTRVSSYDLNG